MKIIEIITGPIRDEYLEKYDGVFDNAPVVAKIRTLELRRHQTNDQLDYGLFNGKNLVGILRLEKYNNSYWQVRVVQIAQSYKGQGYGTFLYDYVVMNDKNSIPSDSNQSENGPGGSRGLWEKLYRHGRFIVQGYNLSSDTILPKVTPQDIYNQKENIVWLGTPKDTETINEMLLRLNESHSSRSIVWYGPTVLSPDNF